MHIIEPFKIKRESEQNGAQGETWFFFTGQRMRPPFLVIMYAQKKPLWGAHTYCVCVIGSDG